MKIKTAIVLLSVFICFLVILFSCKDDVQQDEDIYVVNHSMDVIYFAESFEYPDTSLTGVIRPGAGNLLYPGEEGSIVSGNWVFRINKTFQVFIFNAENIDTCSWETVIASHKVLKRYQFREKDLEKLNWTINYP